MRFEPIGQIAQQFIEYDPAAGPRHVDRFVLAHAPSLTGARGGRDERRPHRGQLPDIDWASAVRLKRPSWAARLRKWLGLRFRRLLPDALPTDPLSGTSRRGVGETVATDYIQAREDPAPGTASV